LAEKAPPQYHGMDALYNSRPLAFVWRRVNGLEQKAPGTMGFRALFVPYTRSAGPYCRAPGLLWRQRAAGGAPPLSAPCDTLRIEFCPRPIHIEKSIQCNG